MGRILKHHFKKPMAQFCLFCPFLIIDDVYHFMTCPSNTKQLAELKGDRDTIFIESVAEIIKYIASPRLGLTSRGDESP